MTLPDLTHDQELERLESTVLATEWHVEVTSQALVRRGRQLREAADDAVTAARAYAEARRELAEHLAGRRVGAGGTTADAGAVAAGVRIAVATRRERGLPDPPAVYQLRPADCKPCLVCGGYREDHEHGALTHPWQGEA